MNFDLWLKTGQIKPFNSVEEFEQYTEDCLKLPALSTYINSPLKKSKIKRGFTNRGEKMDSFFEYTFITYMRQVKGYIVERNNKSSFLFYNDPDGKQKKFYPDFLVNGNYAEVKGRFSEKDKCKKDQHPDVQWYFSEDIKLMREELNQLFPDWKSDFLQIN